ncbi:hypothetical protein LLEC1_00757 [Akanthomyces lecanii]|uniref:Asl1-like glycosyl hydrolase catalytic domain-containing protein n=1 Tax=Cordyceps confragosa TaxID=2714763 RepID=A0A179I8A1_CORDF|nr:hypothetical protein LLEC1_00757 [Akanthomyces lecanii]
MQGVQDDIDHYWNTYGKPTWVTEFTCVSDQPRWEPCEDQAQISRFISDVVDLLEKNEHVMAYAYTDGGGLSPNRTPTSNDGPKLSGSGRTYLNAIKKYH